MNSAIGASTRTRRRNQARPPNIAGWSVADARERRERASMEHQRCAIRVDHAAALDFTDEDDVVTLVISAAVMALEPGQGLPEDRQAGGAQAVVDVGKAVALERGEALAQGQLLGCENIDDVVRACVEQRK